MLICRLHFHQARHEFHQQKFQNSLYHWLLRRDKIWLTHRGARVTGSQLGAPLIGSAIMD